MKTNNWEKELEKGKWHVNHIIGGLKRGCNCELENECETNLKSFIRQLLNQERKRMVEEIEEKMDSAFACNYMPQTYLRIVEIFKELKRQT